MILHNPIQHIIRHVPLHRNLFPSTRRLGHTRPRRKFFPKLFCNFFQIQAKSLEAGDFRDEFAFVALDAFDDDFGREAFLFFARGGRFGFGGFLLGVFFGAFESVGGEGAKVGGEGFGGVEGGV